MRRITGAMLACAVCAACLAAAGSAWAMNKTVCASKCQYTSIQAAINGSPEGSTITIGKGTYTENVVVTKPLTLVGSGNSTVVEPATSNPVCAGGSLCGGAASSIFLVQANNVTISRMKLEGDNPGLTSKVIVGGKDIDARNGVITNHLAGTFNNLTVSQVTVADVYLRGIYASSGGSFTFKGDSVQNVQAEEASIAIFAFEGSGVIEGNKVTEANDAISANWSKGIHFIGNTVTKSGSGVHTDNNGGSGGSADLIKGNEISECKEDGYGIFVFVPYVSATVEQNKITGCYHGLSAYGGAVPGQGPTFAANKVDGTGAKTSDPTGTYGAYLTSDQLGYAFGDVTATLTGNTIEHTAHGLFVTQSNPTAGQPAGGQATVTASGNSIMHNTSGANGEPGTVVKAQSNWWGCKQGPSNSPKCDPVSGTVAYTPWLTAKP
jgi:nitrous oxidase accessory protein NosD